jgi:hypothetical protein
MSHDPFLINLINKKINLVHILYLSNNLFFNRLEEYAGLKTMRG